MPRRGPVLRTDRSGHPLFAGVPRPRSWSPTTWAAYYTGHTGFTLADFGTSESGVLGGGAAYQPRTPTSVRLLLVRSVGQHLRQPVRRVERRR